MKKLLAVVLLACSTPVLADCDHIMPFSEPAVDGYRLCRSEQAYLTIYNPHCKVPYYSAEVIEPIVGRKNARKNDFREDINLPPSDRATLNDYKRSGFDRGHMAPAADFSYSEAAMSESFLLSNMVPQYHNPNAGIWSEVEQFARDRASVVGYVRVVSGPLFDTQPPQTIGEGVCVPTATFKIIVDPNGAATSFIVPNVPAIPKVATPRDYIVPMEEVEKRSGLMFK